MSSDDNLPAIRHGQIALGAGYVPAADPNDDVARFDGIRISKLKLKGIEIDYGVDFTNDDNEIRSLSIIAGAFSTGKSSTLQFVSYCLGARSHPQHPEILRKVRAALLEVTLNGKPFVIERAVGEPSQHAYVRPGRIDEKSDRTPERRPLHPAGDPNSLSSFLLSYCGLEGVELREAPSQDESATDPLSFRDLMWFCYLPNERLDDKNLLFESSTMRFVKFGQVFNVIFGCHDDKAVELGSRVKELETRLARARQEANSAEAFVSEQDFGSRQMLEAQHDQAVSEIELTDVGLAQLDVDIMAATTFADELRRRHDEAATNADRSAALLRDRETQIKRLMPLRAQYADDVSKLIMLSEAHQLFDPLRVRVCPACFTSLGVTPFINDGECSLCRSTVESASHHDVDDIHDHDGAQPTAVSGELNVAAELRATRARLAEITQYIDQLDAELPQLRAQYSASSARQSQAAEAIDRATHDSVSPYLTQRDDLISRRERNIASAERIAAAIRLYDSIDRRLVDVSRLERSLESARAELNSSTPPISRSSVITSVSQRYLEILTAWKYPKLDQAFVHTNLKPFMRGLSYADASSGGRTLISLAWMLSIFETAWESGSHHPGFLMIDSPQKNLGHGGQLDKEFADSVAVSEIYRHLHDWLAGPGAGAQVIVVDNTPPAVTESDVVVRFSGRAEDPPYGLITDET
ncbi:hypothetical protein QWI29_12990 [Mycolicibacterium neoaurum]|uniref:hypothetical protein n=1 Tax=Mycolicibacterium neoaurum TaxID=1795 RepID=UPI0026733B73|nr:hypothetical protein [Mycolicibacterium neoaurum]MDO3400949.1 hypothetical protein [Mycolicibacterium neoaurum]